MKRIGILFLTVILLFLFFTTNSQAQWAATYWGSYLNDIHKTPDDGFIASRGEEGGLRIEKFDPVGVPVWSKTYYHNNGGMLYSRTLYTHVTRRSRLEPTSDDGYALATLIYQQPNGTYGAGRHDIWFLKLDAEGEIEWQRTYGGADYDSPSDMQQTTDGGYILAGRTKSFGQRGSGWSSWIPAEMWNGKKFMAVTLPCPSSKQATMAILSPGGPPRQGPVEMTSGYSSWMPTATLSRICKRPSVGPMMIPVI